jgi:probable HAF family extracellular repeat protein
MARAQIDAEQNPTLRRLISRREIPRSTPVDPYWFGPYGPDVPELATTCAFGINNRGHIVGQHVDAAGTLHGYLWQPKHGFETIDAPPGAPVVGPTGIKGTTAVDITDRGHIVLTIGGGFFKGRAVPIGG